MCVESMELFEGAGVLANSCCETQTDNPISAGVLHSTYVSSLEFSRIFTRYFPEVSEALCGQTASCELPNNVIGAIR